MVAEWQHGREMVLTKRVEINLSQALVNDVEKLNV